MISKQRWTGMAVWGTVAQVALASIATSGHAQGLVFTAGQATSTAARADDSVSAKITTCIDTARRAIMVDRSPVPPDVDVYKEYARRDVERYARGAKIAKACLATISMDAVPPDKMLIAAGLQMLAGDRAGGAVTIERLATLPTVPLKERHRLANGLMVESTVSYELTKRPDRSAVSAMRAMVRLADSAGTGPERVRTRIDLAKMVRAVDSLQAYHVVGEVVAVFRALPAAEREVVGSQLTLLTDSMTAWSVRDGVPARATGFAILVGNALSDTSRVVTSSAQYFNMAAQFGTVAPAIEAPRWINAPAGTRRMTFGQGRVTLIEFTNWACGICKRTYKPMMEWQRTFGPKGFQAVIATALIGSFEGPEMITPEEEAVADSGYFVGRYGITFPIAIASSIIDDPNAKRFNVFGAPHFVLIDRRGIVRNAWYAWDDRIESAISEHVRALVAEQ